MHPTFTCRSRYASLAAAKAGVHVATALHACTLSFQQQSAVVRPVWQHMLPQLCKPRKGSSVVWCRAALRVTAPSQDDCERDVEVWLRRKFESRIREVEVVLKEDLDLVGMGTQQQQQQQQ